VEPGVPATAVTGAAAGDPPSGAHRLPFLAHDPRCVASYLRIIGGETPARLRRVVREAAARFGLRCPVPLGEEQG